LLGIAQPPPPPVLGRQLGRQLIAARLAIELVLRRIGGLGLLEDLAGDLLVVHRRIAARVGENLGPIDRDHPTLASPASAQSSSTAPNRPASATSWRTPNRASVA
jgi:hypothetical protein